MPTSSCVQSAHPIPYARAAGAGTGHMNSMGPPEAAVRYLQPLKVMNGTGPYYGAWCWW